MTDTNDEPEAGVGIFGGKLGDESDPVIDPGHHTDAIARLQAKVKALTEERDDARAEVKRLLEEDTSANPARQRRALRRLQGGPPPEFEQMITLFYEWREYAPQKPLTDMMRTVFEVRHHNLSDRDAIGVMKDKIKETRLSRLNGAIARLGLEEAEKLLLSANASLPRSHLGQPCRVCGETWTDAQCPGEPF